MLVVNLYLSYLSDRETIAYEIENAKANLANLYAGSKDDEMRASVYIEVPCSDREWLAWLAGHHRFDEIKVRSYEWQECRSVQTVKVVLSRDFCIVPF